MRMKDVLGRHWRQALTILQPEGQDQARRQSQFDDWLKQLP